MKASISRNNMTFGVGAVKLTTQMISTHNHLYNKSSASNILGGSLVTRVEVFTNCIRVEAEGKRPTMISKKKFVEEFANKRRRASLDLIVLHDPLQKTFVVKNPNNGNAYTVRLIGKEVRCQCEDYLNQLQFNPITIGTKYAMCKHGYAVLRKLGYESLKDYLTEN